MWNNFCSFFASSLSTEIQTPKRINGQSFKSFTSSYSNIQIKIFVVSVCNHKLGTRNKLVSEILRYTGNYLHFIFKKTSIVNCIFLSFRGKKICFNEFLPKSSGCASYVSKLHIVVKLHQYSRNVHKGSNLLSKKWDSVVWILNTPIEEIL